VATFEALAAEGRTAAPPPSTGARISLAARDAIEAVHRALEPHISGLGRPGRDNHEGL
jgi:hypothetical protein